MSTASRWVKWQTITECETGEYNPSWAPSSTYVEKWICHVLSLGGWADRNHVRKLARDYFDAWKKVFDTPAEEIKVKCEDDKSYLRGYPIWRATVLEKGTGRIIGTELWFGDEPSKKAISAFRSKFPNKRKQLFIVQDCSFWMELVW